MLRILHAALFTGTILSVGSAFAAVDIMTASAEVKAAAQGARQLNFFPVCKNMTDWKSLFLESFIVRLETEALIVESDLSASTAGTGAGTQAATNAMSGPTLDATGAGAGASAAQGVASLGAAKQGANVGSLQELVTDCRKLKSDLEAAAQKDYSALNAQQNRPGATQCRTASRGAEAPLASLCKATMSLGSAAGFNATELAGLQGALGSIGNAAKDMAGNPAVQMGALMGAAAGAAALLGKDKGGNENGNSDVGGPSEIPAPEKETIGNGNLNGNCASGLTWNASLNSCQTTFTGGVSGAPTLTQETDTSTKNSALVDSATADKLKVKGGGAETKDALANVGGNRPGANLSGGGSGASGGGTSAGSGGGQAAAGGAGQAGVGANGNYLGGFYNPQSFGGSGEGAATAEAFAGGLDVNYINNPNGQAVSAGGAGSNGQVRRVNLSLKDFCTKYPTHGRCKVRRDPLLQ